MMRHIPLRTLLFIGILSACAPSTPTVTGDTGDTPDQTMTASPNAQKTDPKHGEVRVLSIGAMSGENGILANGIATSYFFEDNGTIIGVQLNIAAAEDGSSYIAWAENGKKERVQIGILEAGANDVRHAARIDSQKNLQEYTRIIVTKQSEGGSSADGQIVATGTLKATGK